MEDFDVDKRRSRDQHRSTEKGKPPAVPQRPDGRRRQRRLRGGRARMTDDVDP